MQIFAVGLRLRAVGAELLVIAGKLGLVAIDFALIRIAVSTVLVQIAAIVIDILLVGAVCCQIGLVVIDGALIRIAIGTVLRQIFLIVPNVFLVVLNVLLLRSRILALSIHTTGEQTGKSNREHTSTNHKFCFHLCSLLFDCSWCHHHTCKIKHQEHWKVAIPHAGPSGRDLRTTREERNYFSFKDLWTASSTPFTNAPESSEENFFARSTASFSTTLGGVSVPFIS